MSNFSSFVDVINQQNLGQPLTYSTAGSSAHVVMPLAAGTPNGGANAVLNVPNPMALAESANATFPGRAASARPFIVRAAGTISLGGGVQYQIDINLGTGLGTAIASTGLQKLGAANLSDNWLIEIEAMWDPQSTNLRGFFYGWYGATSIAQNGLLAQPAPASLASLQFNVGVTFLQNSFNTITVNEFSAEVV
jgi:hypothetical protein